MVVVVLAAVVAIATATEVRRVAQVHPQTDHEEDPEGVMSFHLRRRLNLVAGKDVRYGVGGGETMTEGRGGAASCDHPQEVRLVNGFSRAPVVDVRHSGHYERSRGHQPCCGR